MRFKFLVILLFLNGHASAQTVLEAVENIDIPASTTITRISYPGLISHPSTLDCFLRTDSSPVNRIIKKGHRFISKDGTVEHSEFSEAGLLSILIYEITTLSGDEYVRNEVSDQPQTANEAIDLINSLGGSFKLQKGDKQSTIELNVGEAGRTVRLFCLGDEFFSYEEIINSLVGTGSIEPSTTF